MRVAVAGKGGVGKTTLTALLARRFVNKGYPTLAIDADANPNLALSLGVPAGKASEIKTLLELNKDCSLTSIQKRSKGVDYGFVTPFGVPLIVTGRVDHADTGCLCRAYQLLSRMLELLERERESIVLADMAGGFEYMKRGAVRFIDIMLVIAEPYFRSMQSAVKLKNLAEQLNIKHVYGVINKVRDEQDQRLVDDFFGSNHFKTIASLPFDERLSDARDPTGQSGKRVRLTVEKVISQIESDYRTNLLSHLMFSLSEKFLSATPSDLNQREILAVRNLAKEEQMTMSELARAIKVAHSTATAVVDNLVRKQLVQRMPGPKDRRVVLVRLTDSGKEFYRDHVEAHQRLTTNLISSLTKEEKWKLVELVRKMKAK